MTLGPLAENTYTFEVRATDVGRERRRQPGLVHLHGRHDVREHDDHLRPARRLELHRARASRSSPRTPARASSAASTAVRSPTARARRLRRPHRGGPHLQRARQGRSRQPRPDARDAHVDGRPDRARTRRFLSTPADPSADSTPGVRLRLDRVAATFECNLDGGGWTPCATPFTVARRSPTARTRCRCARPTPPGTRTRAGRRYTWVVDATHPTGSLDRPGGRRRGLRHDRRSSARTRPTRGSGVVHVALRALARRRRPWARSAPPTPAAVLVSLGHDGPRPTATTTSASTTRDAAGNSVSSAPITVTVDNTDPTLTVVGAEPGQPRDPRSGDRSPRPPPTPAPGIAYVNFEQCSETSADLRLRHVDAARRRHDLRPTPSPGRSRPTAPACSRVARDRRRRPADDRARPRHRSTAPRPTGSLTAPASRRESPGRERRAGRDRDRHGARQRQHRHFQRSPAGAARGRDVVRPTPRPPYTATLDTTGGRRRPLRPARLHDRRGRQRRVRPGDDPGAHRQHRSDRHDHGAGRRAERPRHRRADLELGRRAAPASPPSQFQRSPGRRGHLDEPGRELEHDRSQPTASTTSAS